MTTDPSLIARMMIPLRIQTCVWLSLMAICHNDDPIEHSDVHVAFFLGSISVCISANFFSIPDPLLNECSVLVWLVAVFRPSMALKVNTLMNSLLRVYSETFFSSKSHYFRFSQSIACLCHLLQGPLSILLKAKAAILGLHFKCFFALCPPGGSWLHLKCYLR